MTKIRVSRIDYLNAEQVIDPAPKNRGIRMNVYAKERGMDEHVCDLEMQAQPEIRLGKRLRYYQSALDARELPAGEDYGYPPREFHHLPVQPRSVRLRRARVPVRAMLPRGSRVVAGKRVPLDRLERTGVGDGRE